MNYSIIDYIEIAFITGIVYRISLWLKRDLSANLLGYFWGYVAAIILTYLLSLTTLFMCSLWLCPVVILLFFLMHRETIQQFFVVTPSGKPEIINWHNCLIKSLLQGFSYNVSSLILLEKEDSILHHLSISCLLESQINQPLLELLLSSSHFSNEKYIVIAQDGTLIGCNATLAQHNDKSIKENALLLTAHTDAIIIYADAQKRHFILYKDAQQYPACTAIQLETWLKKSDVMMEGIPDANSRQVSFKERSP